MDEYFTIADRGAERRAAEANAEMLYEARMNKKPPTQPVCRTCLAPVDWRYSETLRTWQPFEAGSERLHRCETK